LIHTDEFASKRFSVAASLGVLAKVAATEMQVKAVLFDLDGVLVHSPLDLQAIKLELFGDPSIFLIEGLESYPEDEKIEKEKILRARELEAAEKASLDLFVAELFKWLEEKNIKRGVITRNCRDVVDVIRRKFSIDLGVVIAREDAPPKPDPACIYAACRLLDLNANECVMVGDYQFDIDAGNRAGCRTVFLETDEFRHLLPDATARIKNLSELVCLLESWISIPAEKRGQGDSDLFNLICI